MLTTLQEQLDKLTLNHKQLLIRTQHAEKAKQQWQEQANDYKIQQHDLAQKYTTLKQEKETLENYLVRHFNTEDATVNNCASCPNTETDLCGRCVLYIGGRNGQQNHFRQLVEQQNGQFIHHDGGREDSYQRLAGDLSKADIVLCPLDCVSHSAVNTVKRYCKNHTKPLVFIPHASLSSFAKGLDDVIN